MLRGVETAVQIGIVGILEALTKLYHGMDSQALSE